MATINDYLKNPIHDRRNELVVRGGARSGDVDVLASDFVNYNGFCKDWIVNGADKSMIDAVEVLGKFLAPYGKKDDTALTNSQIRNVFGEIKRIQMAGYSKNKTSFLVLKPKVAYAAGRHNKLGIIVFKKYFDLAAACVIEENTDVAFSHFCEFMEAIVAYHKAYGGKD